MKRYEALGPDYQPDANLAVTLTPMVGALVKTGFETLPEADHYDGFRVSFTGLVRVFDLHTKTYERGIIASTNTKSTPDGEKECAELAFTKMCREIEDDDKTVKVLGGVLIAPKQPDTHSGKERETLDPCGDCRSLLTHSPYFDYDTPIMGVDITSTFRKVETVGKIVEEHAGDEVVAPVKIRGIERLAQAITFNPAQVA